MRTVKLFCILCAAILSLSAVACGQTPTDAPEASETSSSLETEIPSVTTIGEHDHTYGAWETAVDPACETQGVRLAVCTICGAKTYGVLPALGHVFENGFCTRCGVAYFSQELFYEKTDGGYAVSGRGETKDLEIIIPAAHEGLPVTAIRHDAFYTAGDLTAVHIPESVTQIGEYAFYKCRNLKKTDLPAGLLRMDKGAFFGCTGMESVTLPEGLESIGKEAFGECFRLQSVTIPDSVAKIAEGAFFNCISLENITVGKGVTAIGKGAFEGCDALSDVYFTGTQEDWAKIDIAEGNDFLTEANIHFGEG